MSKIFSYLKAIRPKIWYYLNKRKFLKLGNRTYVESPLRIHGHNNIAFEENVYVGYKSYLGAVPLTGESECLLQFGTGCVIGAFNHIYATKKVIFGEKVLTADKVYISDNIHSYQNIHIAIMDQGITQKNDVFIGAGSWIGENVCIVGASIGKNCVIGANSVVTKNIPDYCVAAGNPAIIIKRYNSEIKQWGKTSPDGNFI